MTDDEVASLRSALRSRRMSRSSSTELSQLEATVKELCLVLQSEKQKSAAQLIELTSVREALTREKEKLKGCGNRNANSC